MASITIRNLHEGAFPPAKLDPAFRHRLQAVERALPAHPFNRRRADVEDEGDVRLHAPAVLAAMVGQQEKMRAIPAFRRQRPAAGSGSRRRPVSHGMSFCLTQSLPLPLQARRDCVRHGTETREGNGTMHARNTCLPLLCCGGRMAIERRTAMRQAANMAKPIISVVFAYWPSTL